MSLKNNLLLLFSISFVFVSSSMYGQDTHAENNSMIRFTENKNQWDNRVLYKAQLDGGAMFLEKNCFTYNFYDKETLRSIHSENTSRGSKKYAVSNHAYRMTFLNALSEVSVTSVRPTPDYCNYFIGKDKNTWASEVKNFQEVNYKGIYKNIDLQLLGGNNSLKYNFFVNPGGNVQDIQMSYEGVSSIKLENGGLKIKTSINELTEQKPFAYQWIDSKRVEVQCEFVLNEKTVQFHFAKGYDKTKQLIIDPLLVFAASSGSIADNFGHAATYDNQGNLISGGIAFDVDYPTTIGAYDPTYNGEVDVVITKYNSTGTDLLYSTYLGGAKSDEVVTSLIVDHQDNLLMYGITGSSDFPVTSAGYDSTFNGGELFCPHRTNGNFFQYGTDMFLCKLKGTGSSLLASTFIGGSSNDGINCNNVASVYVATYINPKTGTIDPYYAAPLDSLQYNYGDYYRGALDIDKSGNVYVVSSTRSNDFPTNGFDKKLGGKQDAVVFKMNSDLSSLLWSTYLGGSNNDAGYGLVIDDSSNVYVSGGTRSIDFPVSFGALDTIHNGGKTDGFLAKIKNDGKTLEASTYFGTNGYDQCFYVQLDRKNNVYVIGQTDGKMTATPGVYNNPNSGQFICKMNNTLTKQIFLSIFGNGNGLPNISPTAFLVDDCENIYVSGWASAFNTNLPNATGMPITTNAIDKTTSNADFYLIVLTTEAKALLYGTYLGGDDSGEHVHGGTSRFDKKGIVYQSLCTGCGGNQDFPVTPGAWPHSGKINGSNCNNGVFKIDFQVPPNNAKFVVDSAIGCAPFTVKFKNQSTSWTHYLWDFGGGDTTSTDFNPTRIYTVPGTYFIKLTTVNTACNTFDVDSIKITVYPGIIADFDLVNIKCTDTVKFTDSSKVNPVSWHWDFGDGDISNLQNPVHVYRPGAYDAELIVQTINGCKDTVVVSFDNSYNISVNKDTLLCEGSSVQLQANGGYKYSWLPVTGLNDPTIKNPIASPTITTTYTVQISYVNALGDSCSKALKTIVNIFDKDSAFLYATADTNMLIKGDSTTLHVLTNPIFSVKWEPTTNVKNPNALNTVVTPQITTTYTVSIAAGSCSRTDTITIYVITNECEADDIFVPNTFTPNGDGENDILYARSNVISTIYFAVYNRWGELMFETTDLKKGWDGNYKAMKADPAVFAWYVKGKCFNGKEFFKKGNVTLIR